jgi:hypothetical protein
MVSQVSVIENRSLWARWGSALLCAGVAIAIGLPTGLDAGYNGGLFDAVPRWVANLLMSLPASSCCSRCGRPSARRCGSDDRVRGSDRPGYFRLTRTAAQSVRGELCIDTARIAGLSFVRIIGRHIMSMARAPHIQTAIVAAGALSVSVLARADRSVRRGAPPLTPRGPGDVHGAASGHLPGRRAGAQ